MVWSQLEQLICSRSLRERSIAMVYGRLSFHPRGRPWPHHPRLCPRIGERWMAGPSPAMTEGRHRLAGAGTGPVRHRLRRRAWQRDRPLGARQLRAAGQAGAAGGGEHRGDRDRLRRRSAARPAAGTARHAARPRVPPPLRQPPRADDRAPGPASSSIRSGLIVTNNHVVGHADKIVVSLTDGTRLPAQVIGSDELTDVALIKVQASGPLPSVAFGDSRKVEVGDWVLAAGNPFGLGGSVTAGIISARGRDLGSGPFDNFLQLDAPINPGNSGGPIFNMDGAGHRDQHRHRLAVRRLGRHRLRHAQRTADPDRQPVARQAAGSSAAGSACRWRSREGGVTDRRRRAHRPRGARRASARATRSSRSTARRVETSRGPDPRGRRGVAGQPTSA